MREIMRVEVVEMRGLGKRIARNEGYKIAIISQI